MKRNYSLDLLRIIAMFMVVMLHCFGHGGLVEGSLINGTVNFYIGNMIYALCLVAVNCFVLITGYFQCVSKFKLRKIIAIWGQVIFYSVSIYILLVILNVIHFSLGELVKSFLVITMKRYWFVTAYLLLYVVTPFLNQAINSMSKKCILFVV